MERALIMVLHSVVIGLILYALMVYVFNQKPLIAESRSILIAAVLLHQPKKKMRQNYLFLYILKLCFR